MATTRLSEGQKGEIVARFRQGESSQSLADAHGCSAATITRVVKAALSPDDYEQLKGQRGRKARGGEAAEQPADATPTAPPDDPVREEPVFVAPTPASADPAPEPEDAATGEEEGPDASPGVFAIDDADDFGGDDEDDFSDEEAGSDSDSAGFAAVAVLPAHGDDTVSEARPLQGAALPASAYMLVDKTVELQARPLSEFPELGRLPPGEDDRQALVIFLNPRQAKRQCGRTQRVIKMPDLSLLERTAPYLLAQGISRVVIEGALYALPGS